MRTIGKNRGLARLADADGHFCMVALDQRPPLFEAIAQAKGIAKEQVEYSDVTAIKRLLVELTKAKAKAWTAHFPAFGDIRREGDFARAY
jgi:tagatose-1,6-bisphosphate aldolase